MDTSSSNKTASVPPIPIAEVRIEPDYWSRGHFYEGRRKTLIPLIDLEKLPLGAKLYAAGVRMLDAGQQVVQCAFCEWSMIAGTECRTNARALDCEVRAGGVKVCPECGPVTKCHGASEAKPCPVSVAVGGLNDELQRLRACAGGSFGATQAYIEALERALGVSAVPPAADDDVTAATRFCDGNCTWRDHHPDCPIGGRHAGVKGADRG